MNDLIKAVIASMPSKNTPLDARRTDVLFSKDAVEEVIKQCIQSANNGQHIKVFDKAPEKKAGKPIEIGKIVNAEARIDSGFDSFQCVAHIQITNAKALAEINKDKKLYCFFPILATADTSVRKSINAGGENVGYLYPPLKVLAVNKGLKRSSSNPHLVIL